MPRSVARARRLPVVTFSVLGAAGRRDVTGEVEGVGLASPSPQSAAERQRLSGVAPGLVDLARREGGHPRVQQNEGRPVVKRTTTERLDGVGDQRERLVSPAGEGVDGAEGRSDDRCPDDELPRSAAVEAPLEDPGRAWEVPATEVGEAETEQPEIQRQGMIGRFRDPHGGLSVADGLVEPAELGEQVGEVGPRERRLDGGRPKALGAQVALERDDVSLEEGGRLAELAPVDVRPTQKGRGDHLDRAIAEGARHTQGLLAESEGPLVVARAHALEHHEGGDPREPVRVAERPGEPLRLVEVLPHARIFAERAERVPEVDVEVDGQLGRLPGLGEVAEGSERLLQVSEGLAIGGPRHGPEPRLAEIGDRLVPQLPAQGVMGQPLGLLGHALGREPLEGLGDAGVERALPVVEQALVRHVVRERVLERVLEVRERAGSRRGTRRPGGA